MSLAFAGTAFAAPTEGAWVNGGTQFLKEDGSLARNEWIEGENHSFFYIGADGNYVTGWQTIKEQNSDAEHSYYFNPVDGAMFYNTETPDGYWVNSDGVWIEDAEGKNGGTAQADQQGTEAKQGEEAAAGQGTAAQEEPVQQGNEAASEALPSQNETKEQQTAGETAEAGAADQNADGYSQSNASYLVALLNEKRSAAGKAALPEDQDLMAAAQVRAQEIAQNPDGNGIYYRPEAHYLLESGGMTSSSVSAVSESARKAFTEGGSIFITESAAWGVSSPREAVEDWFAKNQDGQDKTNKKYLLDVAGNGFNAIGASCYVKDGKQYYSVFIGVRH